MELSVVIPIYHSANNAIAHLPAVLSALQGKYKDFEIIFIIDNEQISEDVKALFALEKQYPEMSVHQLRKNYGQQFATLCGYYLAKGDYILSVDEDMTRYTTEICKTDDYKNKEVFYFYYDKNSMYNSDTRKVLSNLYKSIIHKIVNLKRNSTFRIISKSLRNKILKNKHIFWNIDVTIFNNTNNIGSQDLPDCDITDHNSAYNYKRLFQVAFEIAYEHNTIFMNLLFAIIPAIIYYWRFHDKMRTTVVYIFFAIVITSFFLILKICSLSTEKKILNALSRVDEK